MHALYCDATVLVRRQFWGFMNTLHGIPIICISMLLCKCTWCSRTWWVRYHVINYHTYKSGFSTRNYFQSYPFYAPWKTIETIFYALCLVVNIFLSISRYFDEFRQRTSLLLRYFVPLHPFSCLCRCFSLDETLLIAKLILSFVRNLCSHLFPSIRTDEHYLSEL